VTIQEASNPSTEERLIRAATVLFMEKGYGSTSVADILREADANPGSFYHAFPTKQELLVAVLERYRQEIGPMLLEPAWQDVEDPIDRIFALLARYRQALEMTDCSYGCPIGSLSLELHEPDPPVRALLAANFDAWVAAIDGCLESAADRLPLGLNRTALARFVLSVMEGGVMQSRTHRSLRSFDDSVDTLRHYFDYLQTKG
jgi:TetR/AcrR family transcriptional regulator, transcriptional repressor for nem operon